MANAQFSISIEGDEVVDLYQDLIGLTVELDATAPATFRFQLALLRQEDGTWTHLDDERLQVWNAVALEGGFEESGLEPLVSGYITQVRPLFDPDETRCTLEITGLDHSVRMDRQEKLKDWPDKKDSDIVAELFDAYGLSATPGIEITDTSIVHDKAVSTIIQRETDWQFLQRLALRNGFHCYLEGDTGYFQPPNLNAEMQPLLAAHFGDETTLVRLSLTVDALQPTEVAMYQVDRFSKEVLEAAVSASTLAALGATDSTALVPAGLENGQVYVGKNAATGTPEMSALCQGLFHEGAWFVEAEGEVNANAYAHVLRPRRPVTLKGVAETYSGIYYVTHVTHAFTPDGYGQFFRARRNGVLPTGDEDFAGGGLLGGLF